MTRRKCPRARGRGEERGLRTDKDSQEVETTKAVRGNVVRPYPIPGNIIESPNKEWDPDTANSTDESWGRYARSNEPVT